MTDERVTAKAARLAALLDLVDAGILETTAINDLAAALNVHRATLWRDLQLLPEVRRRRDQIRTALINQNGV